MSEKPISFVHPEAPETKKALQQITNAMLESIAIDQVFCDGLIFLNKLQAFETVQRQERKENREEHFAEQLAKMRPTEQRVDLREERDNLTKKIEATQAEIQILQEKIEVTKTNIVALDVSWKQREEKQYEKLIHVVAERNIQMQGENLTPEQMQARLDFALKPMSLSLQEKLMKPHMMEKLEAIVPKEPQEQRISVLKQMQRSENVQAEILLNAGEDPIMGPALLRRVLANKPGIGKALFDIYESEAENKAKDTDKMLHLLCDKKVDEKTVSEKQTTVKELKSSLAKVSQALAANHADKPPTLRR